MTQPLTERIDDIRFLGGVFVDTEERFRQADYTETLKAALPVLEQMEAAFFAAEQDPLGAKWQPLSPVTVKRKGHDRILFETGRLKGSLTGKSGDAIRETTHRGLIFGTAVEYAGLHQDGAGRIPQRAHTGITDNVLDGLVEQVADRTVEVLTFTL